MMTLWIVWTLLAGQPVDANTYMTQAMCESQLAEAKEMLRHAKAQRKDAPDYELMGCYAVEAAVPHAS